MCECSEVERLRKALAASQRETRHQQELKERAKAQAQHLEKALRAASTSLKEVRTALDRITNRC